MGSSIAGPGAAQVQMTALIPELAAELKLEPAPSLELARRQCRTCLSLWGWGTRAECASREDPDLVLQLFIALELTLTLALKLEILL